MWLPFVEPSPPAPIGSPSVSSDFLPIALALTRDTLAPAALCDVAQEALVETADRQDRSPARFAARQDFVQPSDLPSSNAPHAQSHARKTILARDESGDLFTLDLHVARLSESRWEATAFDRAGAARGGAFPYAESPLGVAALSFDPGAGRFVLPEVGRMLQLVSSQPARPRALHVILSGFTALAMATVAILVLVKAFA